MPSPAFRPEPSFDLVPHGRPPLQGTTCPKGRLRAARGATARSRPASHRADTTATPPARPPRDRRSHPVATETKLVRPLSALGPQRGRHYGTSTVASAEASLPPL